MDEALLALEPTDVTARVDLGLLYQKANRLDEAVSTVLQATLRSDNTVYAQMALDVGARRIVDVLLEAFPGLPGAAKKGRAR